MQHYDRSEVRMFNTIIWATDGSESSDLALSVAKGLAEQEGSALVAVHVVQVYASALSAGLPLHADDEEIKAKVEGQVSKLKDEGLDVTAKVVTSPSQPAHVIADVAKDVGADLIVVGTHGHTALGGLLVGSVTHRLLHLAPCPVLAVPPVRQSKREETPDTAHAVS